MPTITPSPSGTIDGVAYDTVHYVYDTSGLGVVTDVLYYEGGNQVLDRQLFSFASQPEQTLHYGNRTVLPNGDFTLTVTGFHDANGYEVNTYAGTTSATAVAGELIRSDNYTYTSPTGGVPSGFTDTIQEAGPGSSGQVDGAYFDTVMTVYDPSGKITAKDWYNTTYGPIDHSSPVATQSFDPSGGYSLYVGSVLREQKTNGITGQPYVSELDQYDASGALSSRTYYTADGSVYWPAPATSADLSITLPAAATVSAAHSTPLGTIAIVDPWAASHAGTMALTVSVSAGSLTMSGASGAGKSLHVVGTLSQLNADLATLDYTGAAAGTDQLQISVWNQAGVTQTKDLSISVSGASTTPPTITSNDLSIALSASLSVAAKGSSPVGGIAIDDAWAAGHPGSLALNISAGSGTLTMTGAAATASALHVSGTLAQLNADLQTLVYHAPATAGTDAISFNVWNQAGVSVVGVIHETTTV